MTQNAVVKKVVADMAEIEVRRVSACGHDCSQCGGGCAELTRTGPVVVLARNPLKAQPGDTVVVESSTRSILGFAAVVYLLPLVLFLAGYLAASSLGAGGGLSAGAGGLCFLLAVGAAILVDRRVGAGRREMFSIVRILPNP